MRMADPKPTFSYFVSEMTKRHPNLAFLHLIEPRTQGDQDREFESWEVCLWNLPIIDGHL